MVRQHQEQPQISQNILCGAFEKGGSVSNMSMQVRKQNVQNV
jgi:hypothetical protein